MPDGRSRHLQKSQVQLNLRVLLVWWVTGYVHEWLSLHMHDLVLARHLLLQLCLSANTCHPNATPSFRLHRLTQKTIQGAMRTLFDIQVAATL
jgi:hypothetical protein